LHVAQSNLPNQLFFRKQQSFREILTKSTSSSALDGFAKTRSLCCGPR